MAATRSHSDRGFTLIELLIACLLFVTLAANVAALTSIATRASATSRQQTTTTLLAVQKMEELQSNPTLAFAAFGALDHNVAGCTDFLDFAGNPVASVDTTAPAAALYLRRWRGDPLPSDPTHALVLQVLVTTVDSERRQSGSPTRHHEPGDSMLVDVKMRGSE
jgi:prepilin-type N-terminal cleavage/methylation domain-containing protein